MFELETAIHFLLLILLEISRVMFFLLPQDYNIESEEELSWWEFGKWIKSVCVCERENLQLSTWHNNQIISSWYQCQAREFETKLKIVCVFLFFIFRKYQRNVYQSEYILCSVWCVYMWMLFLRIFLSKLLTRKSKLFFSFILVYSFHLKSRRKKEIFIEFILVFGLM